jgi:hypothetical protein
MILDRHRIDDGFTGLELIIILVVLICVAAVLLVLLGGGGTTNGSRTFPGGLAAESMYMSGDNLQLTGNVYGFPSVSGMNGNSVRIIFQHPDPGRLGVLRPTVSLFMGSTGAIDMSRVQVSWNHGATTEQIIRTPSRTLTCPNWTISGKYNLLPGRTADSDDWLEPGEQFELTLCPIEGVPPGGSFMIIISPDGVAMPLQIRRTVPPGIRPVMNLG